MKISINTCIGLFLAVLVFAGCGNKAEQQQKQQEDLAKEVLAIHDEVMPRSEELVKLRKQLKDKVNVWAADAGADHGAQIREATAHIDSLTAADKSMMDWMHNYNGAQGLYEHEDIIKYLTEEKAKISEVRDNTEAAIAAARKFLEENP